ncbi:hypothetical protein FRB99_007419, partial [Tulasnella sp. 403]
PDITAAFEGDFGDKGTTFWPCIRLAGEIASKGKSREDQESQAISYLHYLLLARPDLYLAQGLLASDNNITFLVGIGGFGVQQLKLGWGDEELSKLLYAFIYRTYDPGPFADPSYKLDPIQNHQPTWTITLEVKSEAGGVTAVPCPNFLPLYASSPFETRTHVFVIPEENSVDVDGKKLAVIKDQVCRTYSRFDEHEILEHVHKPKRVPGVVEAVYHDSINLPSQLGGLDVRRVKHRHGLRQLGNPFMSIPTVKEMLQVAFDTVEVLRFLKAERNILHRDISAGNLMYVLPKGNKQELDTSSEGDEVLHFSEFFLSGSSKSPQTAVLLVDFNHAEHLANKRDEHFERVERTGTAVFMSRAVELGHPMNIPDDYSSIPPIPPAPEQYANHYRDTRLRRFPETPVALFQAPAKPESAPWRHELDHDVESVFWLMLYWAMTAQPPGGQPQPIVTSSWSSLTGGVMARDGLLNNLSRGSVDAGTFHSTFQPHLAHLFKSLARILSSVDRHWLDKSETRNDPEYFAEAFQRLILQFLINHPSDNNDNGFMDVKINENPRESERHIRLEPLSSTSNQRSHATSQGKRTSDMAANEEPKPKRSRT